MRELTTVSEKMEPGALESHDAACQDDTHAKGHEGSSGRSTEDEVVASKRTGIVLVRLQKATCVASKTAENNLSEDGIPASSIAKDAQRPWGLHLEAKDPEKSRPEQWMVCGGVAE